MLFFNSSSRRVLNKKTFDQLLGHAKIMAQDSKGLKVLHLEDGRYLKLFRYRNVLSIKRYMDALRFAAHAEILKRRGIPTVSVLNRVWIPHLRRSGIFYEPLDGCTLRQIVAVGKMNSDLVIQLGAFFAELHQKGIYYRSLHMGNVILCPNKKLGLIDILDMQTYPWPLRAALRLRNFRHLFRYSQDTKALSDAGIEHFIQGYMKTCLRPRFETKMRTEIKKWLSQMDV